MKSSNGRQRLAAVLLCLGGAAPTARAAPFGPDQFTPTQVARHAAFYVGGAYVGPADNALMTGQMYVEAWAPSRVRHKYPLVLIHGLGQTATTWMATPDGRKGWADYFVDEGYVVYMVDQPNRGRSPWLPDSDGKLRTSNLPLVQRLFTASARYGAWPQAAKHTQWPGAGAGAGQRGDSLFDSFYASIVPSLADNRQSELLVRAAAAELLDKIGPAVLLVHSQAGLFGWSIADARPALVKGIVAVEPSGPPFQNATQATRELAWGLTNIPVRYDPPVSEPGDIEIEQQPEADGKDLLRCWRQREPARKLANLQHTPVLVVTSEASYHAPYDHCTAAFLRQAGVPTTFWPLEAQGIRGNGHLMMLEKNNLEIARRINAWLSEHLD
nr:alpha/beta hydrolase [uncultured Duganella sp.]